MSQNTDELKLIIDVASERGVMQERCAQLEKENKQLEEKNAVLKKELMEKEAMLREKEERTTELDGWILKFFPDDKGKTQKKVQWNTDMPSEMMRVSFTHQYIAPYTGDVIDEVPMELWAGFVGYEEDPKTQAIIPKIGWLARMALEQIEE